jgi:photosystem II stability/assembly factor-like uncharacterized protein
MSNMIEVDGKLIRISPKDSHKIECSTDGGRSWSQRYNSSSVGDFEDLTDNGDEIIATTSKGLYSSKDGGRSWSFRSR